MKIFISWSGERSKEIATILRDWLPNIIQAVKPWMSDSDINKGVRWSADIASQLEQTCFGIICLTPENLEEPWILFESGALSKTLDKTFVCPYLFDVEPSDLKGPLVQFQATQAKKEDTRKLVHTINQVLGDSALSQQNISKAFDVWWPELEGKLGSISRFKQTSGPHRTDRELLEEVLELVRTQTRLVTISELTDRGIHYPADSTPGLVEIYLLGDPNLKPETAMALAELFHVAYAQFSKPSEPSSEPSMKMKTSKRETRQPKGERNSDA